MKTDGRLLPPHRGGDRNHECKGLVVHRISYAGSIARLVNNVKRELGLLFRRLPLVAGEAFGASVEDLPLLLKDLQQRVFHRLAADVARDLHLVSCLNSTSSITASGEPGPPTGPW